MKKIYFFTYTRIKRFAINVRVDIEIWKMFSLKYAMEVHSTMSYLYPNYN